MDVDEIESTEDLHKFGSFQCAIADPMTAKVFDLYKNRIVWLFVLVFMNIFLYDPLFGSGGRKLNDWHKLVGKDFIVSFLLGIIMVIGAAVVASFRAPEIILVVGLSMILTVIIGSLIGLLLPFILTRLKLDPATASAPSW